MMSYVHSIGKAMCKVMCVGLARFVGVQRYVQSYVQSDVQSYVQMCGATLCVGGVRTLIDCMPTTLSP
jgi:hypothetical protein